MLSDVVIVPTGVANLASVRASLRRLGARSVVDADPVRARSADHVILPGVGAFGPAMQQLRSNDLGDALRERVGEGRPTLTICLGMHILCVDSEESPGVSGLGLVDASVRRYPATVRVPQFGWNRVEGPQSSGYLRSGYAYFANAYRLSRAPQGWDCAMAEHGGPFVAALERGDVVACQFHPELSGLYGAALLGRWLGQGAAC